MFLNLHWMFLNPAIVINLFLNYEYLFANIKNIKKYVVKTVKNLNAVFVCNNVLETV